MARLVRGYESALMRAPISTTGAVAAMPNPQDHVALAKSTVGVADIAQVGIWRRCSG